jgi:hypothetical protein
MDERLNLAERRDIGQLLSTAWRLFTSHFLVFFTITLLVYAPYGLLVNGIALGGFDEGADASPALLLGAGAALVGGILLPALVTALHVVLVQGLARGEEPAIRSALAGAAPRLGTVVLVALLYAAIVLAGFIALIIPGIYLAVRLYFGTQAAVVDGDGPTDALRRSWDLVRDQWWVTAGSLLLVGVLVGITSGLIREVFRQIDNDAVFVVLSVILETVAVSFSAIFGTLLFFSLRARKQLPWQGIQPVDPSAPERPTGLPN